MTINNNNQQKAGQLGWSLITQSRTILVERNVVQRGKSRTERPYNLFEQLTQERKYLEDHLAPTNSMVEEKTGPCHSYQVPFHA